MRDHCSNQFMSDHQCLKSLFRNSRPASSTVPAPSAPLNADEASWEDELVDQSALEGRQEYARTNLPFFKHQNMTQSVGGDLNAISQLLHLNPLLLQGPRRLSVRTRTAWPTGPRAWPPRAPSRGCRSPRPRREEDCPRARRRKCRGRGRRQTRASEIVKSKHVV